MSEFGLTSEQLEKLPTPRLLNYYKSKRGLRYLFMCDCWGEKQFSSLEDEEYSKLAIEYVDNIKAILDTREHLERKWRRIVYVLLGGV